MDSNRIGSITGIRGIGALLVIWAHLSDFSYVGKYPVMLGELGVITFFSLSGFLMAYLYIGKESSLNSAYNYVISRFSRIAPAYLFIVVISFCIFTFIDNGFIYPISKDNLLRHFLFSGNVSVFWSIPPEVQFYFLFLLIWSAVSLFVNEARLSCLSFLVLSLLIAMCFRDFVPGTFVVSKLHFFLAGAMAGVLRSKVTLNQPGSFWLNSLHFIIVVGSIVFVINLHKIISVGENGLYSYILGALFSSFFIFIFSFPSVVGKFCFENKILLSCGEWSFSIYLLHMPVIYVTQKFFSPSKLPALEVGVIVLATLFISWLSFNLVEKPGARVVKIIGRTILNGTCFRFDNLLKFLLSFGSIYQNRNDSGNSGK